MFVRLTDTERKVAEEFFKRIVKFKLDWHVDGNGWVRTMDFRKNGTLYCFPTEVLYVYDTPEVYDEEPYRTVFLPAFRSMSDHFVETYSLSTKVWNSIWWAERNTPNHDRKLNEFLVKITNAQKLPGVV